MTPGPNDHTVNPLTAPGDEIPVDTIHRAALKSMAVVANGQKPALAGKSGPPAAGYDPKAALPKRFGFLAPPKGAPTAEVKAIFDELTVPVILEGDGSLARFPFTEAALKDYAADVSVDDIFTNADKYPLRIATLRAFQAVRRPCVASQGISARPIWEFFDPKMGGAFEIPVSPRLITTPEAAVDAAADGVVDADEVVRIKRPIFPHPRMSRPRKSFTNVRLGYLIWKITGSRMTRSFARISSILSSRKRST